MTFLLSAVLSSLLLLVGIGFVAHAFFQARAAIARALGGEIDVVITERLVTAVELPHRLCPVPTLRHWQPLPLAA